MMRVRVAIFVAMAALGISACIIGPKQDDPASADETPLSDTGAADLGESSGDTSPAVAIEAGSEGEAGRTDATSSADAKADGKADGDAASDGVTEGG